MKVLNLYAGIGGNRKLWTDVEVTAVENNKSIAAIYQDFFPNDKMIITDAHQYLLEHFKEYDFIWSSPPCPTHSRARHWKSKGGHVDIVYPNMKLYEEIILLDKYFGNPYCVENVIGFYEPLIKPQNIDRHYYWANFHISNIKVEKKFDVHHNRIDDFERTIGFNLSKYSGICKKTIMRNCVEPEVGLHILECARGNYNYLKQNQENLFKKEDLIG